MAVLLASSTVNARRCSEEAVVTDRFPFSSLAHALIFVAHRVICRSSLLVDINRMSSTNALNTFSDGRDVASPRFGPRISVSKGNVLSL